VIETDIVDALEVMGDAKCRQYAFGMFVNAVGMDYLLSR